MANDQWLAVKATACRWASTGWNGALDSMETDRSVFGTVALVCSSCHVSGSSMIESEECVRLLLQRGAGSGAAGGKLGEVLGDVWGDGCREDSGEGCVEGFGCGPKRRRT